MLEWKRRVLQQEGHENAIGRLPSALIVRSKNLKNMIFNPISPEKHMRAVLVCGIPGTGKTTYSKWLAQQKAFDHLEFDELLSGIGTPAQLQLIALLKTSPKEFVHKLFTRRRSTVIDWGFPLASIALVRELQQGGIVVWWFDGDREAALQSFAGRGTVSLEAFRIQVGGIEKEWDEIKTIIGDRVIKAVAAGPIHLAPERIFVEMFSNRMKI
jgi:hypothetical protein